MKTVLNGSSQLVSINNEKPDGLNIVPGVPQGSILRPLLCVINIAVLPKRIKNSHVQSCADDTQLMHLFVPENIDHGNISLNEDIWELISFSTNHNLSVDPIKLTHVIFCPESYRHRMLSTLKINIRFARLPHSKNDKILDELRFTKHVSNLI